MPPQRLPLRIQWRAFGHGRADFGGEPLQQYRCAAVLACGVEIIGQSLAVCIGRGVVIGPGGGIEAQIVGITNQHQHGWRFGGQAAQGCGVQKLGQGVAVERKQGGKAGSWRRGFGNAGIHAKRRPAIGGGEIQRVEAVAALRRGEHRKIGAPAHIGRRGSGAVRGQ